MLRALLTLVLPILGCATAAAEPPRVVVSLLPLHSLAASVMGDLGEPRLLVQGAASPHSFALRPSDAAALQDADLVIWVGEGLESFLAKPLENLAGRARVLELAEAEGVALLPTRDGSGWAAHGHEHEHDDEHDHEDQHAHEDEHDHEEHGHGATEDSGEAAHSHGAYDPHIWLDPANAEAIVEVIAMALAEIDPANAATYRSNAAETVGALQAMDEGMAARLAPVAERPYLVFHDGYQYFEAHYGLSPLGAVAVSPERSPGAGHLAELRTQVQSQDVACVFSEPQFEPQLLDAVIEGSAARKAVLDPLGATLEPGPKAYFLLMDRLAESLAACLAPRG
ncbi:MAG: zinc ABC transporter substrate-binding protein [Rhodovibrionaceae bacterium]